MQINDRTGTDIGYSDHRNTYPARKPASKTSVNTAWYCTSLNPIRTKYCCSTQHYALPPTSQRDTSPSAAKRFVQTRIQGDADDQYSRAASDSKEAPSDCSPMRKMPQKRVAVAVKLCRRGITHWHAKPSLGYGGTTSRAISNMKPSPAVE